jgi:2-dehydropantoate 2-reductase
MKVLVHGAWAVCLAGATWLSAVCEVFAEVCLPCLHNVQISSTIGHHFSIFQEVIKGWSIDIDNLNGGVVAFRAPHQIATPVNACITDLIRFRDSLPSR